MARRRDRPLVRLGLALVAGAIVVALVDVLARLNLLERAIGALVAQAGARRVTEAIAASGWALALLAAGLACLGLGLIAASRRSMRRVRRALRPRRPARRSGRARPRRRR